MIQEAQPAPDGRLVFSWWGPRFGYRSGLDIGSDPAVILFKPGYATLIVQNGERPGMRTTDAIRVFTRNGETLRLQRFRGSALEWVAELRRLVHPGPTSFVSDAQRDRSAPRTSEDLSHAETESARLPQAHRIRRFRASLKLDRRFLMGELRR